MVVQSAVVIDFNEIPDAPGGGAGCLCGRYGLNQRLAIALEQEDLLPISY
jgi:hypothetical protein